MTTIDPKVLALAAYFKTTTGAVTQSGEAFEVEGEAGEWLVLTDAEADKHAENEIKESVWAFNADFLSGHMEGALRAEDIRKLQEQLSEDATPAFLRLIKDPDHFVADAILSDGRGHFISHYDGDEREEKVGDEWFYIYRVG